MPQYRDLSPRFRKALILENPDPTLDEYLVEQGIEVERLPETATMNRDYVLERLREGQHDLLFKRSRFEVDEEVVHASPNLAAVILCCIGDDSVDKLACARHGVLVLNDPISNGRSVAEMVIGEIICLARRIFFSNDAGRKHIWTKNSTQRYELKGKVLSLIGLGNIGKQVAQLAESMGMIIHFFDTHEVAREVGAALGWTRSRSLAEAFREADVVSLHVSAEDSRGQSNRNLISYDLLSQLGANRGATSPRLFINAARGFLYEPDELKRAVAEGHIRAAAVDVFPEEPGSAKDQWANPFAEVPEVVTTPHIGAATEEAQPRIAAYVAGTARLLNDFGTVRDTVYAPRVTIGVEAEAPYWALAVVHSDARGTKKAISDAIYNAGANYLQSAHRDFPKLGIAYDLSAIDRPLTAEQVEELARQAEALSGDPRAIRSVRQFQVSA